MLQKLNERFQGMFAWIIIILIAVTFTMFGIDYYLQSRHDSVAQAEVNGQPIPKQAFELNYRRARQFRDPTKMTQETENLLRQQVLNEMIVNAVSLQSAQNNGFEVSTAQADTAIVNIPQFQQDGHFSTDRYQQALNGALFTPQSFQKEVRQGMLLNQQRFAFIGTEFALPAEVEQFVKLFMQTRDYRYLRISAVPFLNESNVTDQEITTYYQQHQKDFLTQERVNVNYVRVSLSDIKKNIELTDEQIARYYEDNQSNYYTPAQWEVAHILFLVPEDATEEERDQVKQNAETQYQLLQKNPGQFATIAKAISADKLSAAKGGVLPWIVAGQTEFDKALVALKTPGEIAAPIRSQHGYEIFKLINFKPATVKPLEKVKQEIHDQLLTDTAQTKYAQILDELSDLSYQTPDSLEPVAKTLHLNILQSAPFSRLGGGDEFTRNKQVIHAAFSHDVLSLGNNSEPIQLNNEAVVVLRVNRHFPTVQKPLVEVRADIVNKLAQAKAKAEARKLGKAILALSQEPKGQEVLLDNNHLQWKSVIASTRDADEATEAVNEMVFNLARIGSEAGHSLVGGDYVIVHLEKINDGSIDKLDKEQLASITQQIEANHGMTDYDLYIGYLMNQAKVIKSS